MAKRKRLSPLAQSAPYPGDGAPSEVDAASSGWTSPLARAPIAAVSADAAMQSAFEEVSAELKNARDAGRMIMRLPLEVVEDRYLVRDRLAQDPDEMASLMASLRDRGQQTPIEVVDLGEGRYGLISGWRRIQALRRLHEDAPEADFGVVQAVVRAPATAAEAYRAMVEENEIRADLSFYERAHIAVKAVEQGIYVDSKTAVQSLFSAARAPKRSKISAFTILVRELDAVLRWPEAIPEKLGLSVAAALKADPSKAEAFRTALADVADAGAERAALQAVLRGPATPPAKPAELVPGVAMKAGRGRVTLSGEAVDAQLIAALKDWLQTRGPAA